MCIDSDVCVREYVCVCVCSGVFADIKTPNVTKFFSDSESMLNHI